MASQQSQLPNTIPESTGRKIPTNAFDLMKELRDATKGDIARERQQQLHNRKMKQQMRQETIEKQLMAAEDYTFTEEGKRRFLAMEERIMMEGEEYLSFQMNKKIRDEIFQDFRQRVRREAEERQRQEEKKREEKALAAQKRRDAIVDRIRKKQEAEEKRLQEAAAIKLREIESKKRLEEEAAEVLRADRAAMLMEDELSAIEEQLYLEQLQKKEWLRKEAEKMAQWEKDQQLKDEIETQKRKQKLLDLEEKKMKLAELRKTQNGDVASSRQSDLLSARNEALKLSKQMRIQNKAKFVSKKRKGREGSQQDLFSGSMKLPAVEKMASGNSLFSATHAGHSGFNKENVEFSVNECSVDQTENSLVDISIYKALQTETELHCALKELMAEKRGLRLQLMQKKLSATSGDDILEVKAIQLRIQHISSIETYIKSRVDKLVKKETDVMLNHEDEKGDVAPFKSEFDMTRRFSKQSYSTIDLQQTTINIYHEIETNLREINELVLQSEVVGLFDDAMFIPMEKLDVLVRTAGLLKMKSSDFIFKVKQGNDDDINGYEMKLVGAMHKLDSFLDKVAAYKEKGPRRDTAGGGIATSPLAVLQPDTIIQESRSMPTMATNPKVETTVQNVSINRSTIMSASMTSSPVLLNSISTTKDSKWEEVKKHISLVDDKKNEGVELLPKLQKESSSVNLDDNALRDNSTSEKIYNDEEEDRYISQDEEAIDYESVEGWNECLHTTMATAAHHAAFYGFTTVLELLSKCFDVFTMDNNGRTPLFYASLRNNLDCVLLLVSIDPLWIEVGDIKGETCMHAAVKANGVEVLQFLLTCDVDSSIANYEGLTPAHLAKSFPLLSALHEANSTLYCVDCHSRMPLWYACRDGLKENVELLCSVMPVEYITWQDDDGNSALHIACMFGKSEAVEVISMWLSKLEDFYITNKKNFSPSHVATTADVLRKLYEFGVDLWVADPKGRYPLFINAFKGRVECVALLLELGVAKNKKLVSAKDKQGDSALHAAAMCGHFGCVVLLLYWLSNEPNKQGLTPYDLAIRTKHPHIASLVEYVEGRRASGDTSEAIFQCSFDSLAAVTLSYGSRWTKLYDHVNDSVYYYDRALLVSQWDRPQTFDEDVTCELEIDRTRDILRNFYNLYNQEKLATINDILHVYKGNFSDLFVQLAERYQVQDLSIFSK